VTRPTAAESEALLRQAGREGWWFRAKEDIVEKFLRPHLRPDAAVLLLGCGAGSTVRRLRRRAPTCSIVGLDLDPNAVAACASRDPQGTYRVSDIETDGLGERESVDLVIALDVLEHLKDDSGVVERAAAVLKPHGLLVVNVPAHPWLFSAHDAHLGHVRRYRPAAIEALVVRHGFRLVHATPLFLTTLGLLIVWRRVIQRWLAVPGPGSDVGRTMPRLLDTMLYGLARCEGFVARVGLPCGSSHLVIAAKETGAGARRRPVSTPPSP
jgi:SAM-dependent methyltransferase